MHVPKSWVRAASDCQGPDGRQFRVAVWGWGHDYGSAEHEAGARLQRLVDRVRRGEPFPAGYVYASRPLRGEMVGPVGRGPRPEPSALITRNRYGALVLNTARLLFLDIDLPQPTFLARVLHRRRERQAVAALTNLRDTLRRARPSGTFHVYRTAAGLRVIAVDREYEPGGSDAEQLMHATGTDQAYVQLCRVQESFRARLTPKPWRCHSPLPPGQHPRESPEVQQQFAAWRAEYEKTSLRFATCRYVETLGSESPFPGAGDLIDTHDRLTHAREPLPLA